MWSYLHRRRVNEIDVQFDKNDFGSKNDLENFVKNFCSVDILKSNIIHLLIPDALINDSQQKTIKKILIKCKLLKENQVNKILQFKRIDYARDYYHFDIKTSESVSNLIVKKLKTNKED